MITIQKVSTSKDLKAFVLFQFTLFKDNTYWVPPLISEELETFNPDKNPNLKNCDIELYLAYKNNQIVGKVAAIVNWKEVKELGKQKTRFGWFDVIDDVEVTQALLAQVEAYGKTKGMNHIEGPLGFSNLDKVGVLTEGFNQVSTMISWYSMPYYKAHFEKLGFQVEKKYYESTFSLLDVDITPYKRASKMIQERYHLKMLNFTKTEAILPYVDAMFELFNATYDKLQSFVPITQEQIDYMKQKHISFINPEYIKFIVDKNDKMIAFVIVMPNFAEALQKAKGKLFPFGWWHLLRAKKHSKEVVFYLIGVHPEYQNKGVTAILFDKFYDVFKSQNIKTCIRTPELEENYAMHNLWKNFNPVINKRRSTYLKEI